MFNHLPHKEVEALITEARACVKNNNCDEVRNKYASLSDANDKALRDFCERSPNDCFAASQDYMANYSKTHELISQARVDDTIPDEMKRVLTFVQITNMTAKVRIIEAGIAFGVTQAASDFASSLGFDIAPDKVSDTAKWAAMLFGVGKAGSKATVSSPLKLGETKAVDDVSMTRVGRWMSPDELAQMQNTNKVVQGGGGQTFISTNGIADFKGAAPKGSVYVEFDVPANSLLQGGKDGWFKMIGPDAGKSQQFLLNKQGGEHLPAIKNIEILDKK